MDKFILTINDYAEFTWLWSREFFLETEEKGNWIWSNPAYGGNNEIHPYNGSLTKYVKSIGIPYGRDKGTHTIGEYCGDQVIIHSL